MSEDISPARATVMNGAATRLKKSIRMTSIIAYSGYVISLTGGIIAGNPLDGSSLNTWLGIGVGLLGVLISGLGLTVRDHLQHAAALLGLLVRPPLTKLPADSAPDSAD